MISMNFFQRNVKEALERLRQQYLNLTTNPNISSTNYFGQLDFTEVNKMEIFMFKIYQLTQSVSYQSYIRIVTKISNEYIMYGLLFLLSYFTVLGVWLQIVKSEKVWLSRLYARLLLIPFNVLRTNGRIVNSFK